jgi:F-type H+-transporting ATPase subunit b
MPTVAKVFNFLALVGILIYFLRSPITAHLAARHATIRRELVDAQALRQSADQQLAAVRARLAELPGELETLQARGMDELAHERTRLQATTAAERVKLLDRTRRDIDWRFRVARRELVEHTADLAIRIARSRIEREITADDHARLVDRYAQEVRS